jgi:peptidoglycan/xylan/chitin deacetylase (PgdA/CDA1 family)
MLLILAYHRAGCGSYNNPVPVLRSHFEYLKRSFNVVVPGEPLLPRQLNVCLAFDDAFADFFAHVFPLLQEFSIRAVLGVSTAFILESTGRSMEERLSTPEEHATKWDRFWMKAPFCTWEELDRMAASGLVHIASHSHRHRDMTRPEADIAREASESRSLLENRLKCHVTTFVYPFGKVNAAAHRVVRRNYSFAMRLGSALNFGWSSWKQPLCRVQVDNVDDIAKYLSRGRLALFGLKCAANMLRAGLGKWDRVRFRFPGNERQKG